MDVFKKKKILLIKTWEYITFYDQDCRHMFTVSTKTAFMFTKFTIFTTFTILPTFRTTK